MSTRFLLLLYGDEQAELALDEEQRLAIVGEYQRFAARLVERRVLLSGSALGPAHEGRVVRPGAGGAEVASGPFRDLPEQLGGFFLVECGGLDEAVALAAEVPRSPGVAVEVRPLVPD